MNAKQTGFNSRSLVVLLAAVVAAGAIWYFVSDVFRTKVDSAANQLTHWTPENIAKDPVNYLNFCEKETNNALEKLKANEIAIAQSKGKLKNMKADAATKVKNGEKAVGELKAAYTTAEAKNVWPVNWGNKSLDKETCKRQIVSFHKETESQRNLLQKVNGGIGTLDAQHQKIQAARADANQQLAEIKTNRELLKVQEVTGDLQNRLVEMRGAIQATVNTVSESSNTVMSLEQLTAESAPTVDDAEFDKIMSGEAQPEATPVGDGV